MEVKCRGESGASEEAPARVCVKVGKIRRLYPQFEGQGGRVQGIGVGAPENPSLANVRCRMERCLI